MVLFLNNLIIMLMKGPQPRQISREWKKKILVAHFEIPMLSLAPKFDSKMVQSLHVLLHLYVTSYFAFSLVYKFIDLFWTEIHSKLSDCSND